MMLLHRVCPVCSDQIEDFLVCTTVRLPLAVKLGTNLHACVYCDTVLNQHEE